MIKKKKRCDYCNHVDRTQGLVISTQDTSVSLILKQWEKKQIKRLRLDHSTEAERQKKTKDTNSLSNRYNWPINT